MYFLIERQVYKCFFSSPTHLHRNEGNASKWELGAWREPKVGRVVFGRQLGSPLLQDAKVNTKMRPEFRESRQF